MENKKKGFSCSYALLVVILCGALAFVTDYAIIESKTQRCGGSVINVDDAQVTEKKYSYEDIAGHYDGYPMEVDNDTIVSSITFYPNGTYSYGYLPALHTIGNYIIEDNKIYMNDILSVGSDPQMHVLYSERTLIINSDGTFIDEDANIKPGQAGLLEVEKVKYEKDLNYNSERNAFDSAMESLNRYYIERNYN